MTDEPADVVQRAMRSVLLAADISEAMVKVVAALRGPFEVWAAVTVVYRDGTAHVVDIHSLGPTSFVPGQDIATSLTSATAAATDAILAGRPLFLDVGGGELGLLDTVLKRDGIRSVAVLPLSDGEEVRGLLALLSVRTDGFASEDLPRYLRLVHGIERHLLGLANARLASDG